MFVRNLPEELRESMIATLCIILPFNCYQNDVS